MNDFERLTKGIVFGVLVVAVLVGIALFLPSAAQAVDNDGDGFTEDIDCDDNDDTVFPGAVEVCGDGKNND